MSAAVRDVGLAAREGSIIGTQRRDDTTQRLAQTNGVVGLARCPVVCYLRHVIT
jgi:hypothetical protein